MVAAAVLKLVTDVSKAVIRDKAELRSVCVAFSPTESERDDIWFACATVPTALNVPSPRLIMLWNYNM